MSEIIEEVKLIATRDSNYILYVFQNIKSGTYLMCTRLPNWNTPNVEIGDEGFLQYETVKAGESYYHPITGEKRIYEYSNTYFKNFIRKSETTDSEIIF